MLDFIVNPIAGEQNGKVSVKTVNVLKSCLDERGVEYRFHYSTNKERTIGITQEVIASGATDVIVVGGDGTLHDVLNGFSNFENVNMGLIPCGTGNDFAAALNLPLDAEKALNIILDNQPKYVDFMQMPTIRGINVIGMGIDVEVLKRYSMLKKKTKFGYTKSLLKTLFKFKPLNFDATFNNQKNTYNSYIAAVANGHCFGGGLNLCPDASPTDNELDFIAVSDMNKLQLIGAFIKLKKGKLLTLKQTTRIKIKQIEVDAPIPYVVNVDGELYDNIPFKINVVSDTLKFYRV